MNINKTSIHNRPGLIAKLLIKIKSLFAWDLYQVVPESFSRVTEKFDVVEREALFVRLHSSVSPVRRPFKD